MFKKIIVNLVLITAVSSMTSTTTVFADNSSTEITKSTSLNEDSTLESTSEASSTTETTLTSQEQPVESSQSNQENQISSSPMYNSEEELRKQFETDSRNEVLSFEEYKALIDTLGSLPASQDPAPEARSLFKAGNQRDQIVAEAKKHLGKSYTQSYPDRLGPNKFDCSGLTRYVFLQVTGKNIGDWTVPQEKSGTKINISKANISQLEAGDLLFWGTAGATYHVAIYIGNGQYIHAPNYDRKVEQSQIWWTEFPPSFALKMNFTDSKPQGNPINDGSYVTITQKGYNIFSSFDWSKKNTSDKLFNNTYQAVYRYNHTNGDTYYSLYDSKGAWQGYINSKAVTKADGKRGLWLYNNEFVTVTKKDSTIWGNINDFSAKKGSTNSLYQKTYHAQGKYNHFSGEIYYSLYDNKNVWIGYVNKKDLTIGDGKHGLWLYNNEFVTVTKKDSTIWGNINDFSAKKGSTNSLYQKTYHAQGKYNHFSGEIYYSLYDNKNVWIGYVNKKDLTIGDGKRGLWLYNNEFVTVTKKDSTIWGNINDFSAKKGSTNSLYQKTYHAQGKYNHFSGEIYYSLYDNKNVWIGYVNKKDLTIGDGKRGLWLYNNEFVTVTKKDSTIWGNINDFSAKKGSTNSLYQKTYHAQGKYNHFSGEIYYSLYDNKNVWIGYVNKKDLTIGDGKRGLWLFNNEFVTVTKKDSTIWGNINDFSAKKGSTNSLYQKTYHAQGKYNHFSGEIYYSLYDNKNVWIGYVNKKDLTIGDGKQGIWMRNNEYVTITKKDYPIWGNINDFSSKKGNTTNLYQKTYHAQGRYNHFSGEVYYSLYDNNQKWIGYVNKTGVSVK